MHKTSNNNVDATASVKPMDQMLKTTIQSEKHAKTSDLTKTNYNVTKKNRGLDPKTIKNEGPDPKHKKDECPDPKTKTEVWILKTTKLNV